MPIDRRERIIENLAVASALGFLTLVIAALFLVVDARASAEERFLLSPSGSGLALAGRAGDPVFDRVYRLQGDDGLSYALVLQFRGSTGAAQVAARLSPKGELQELRLLGSCLSRLPGGGKPLLSAFPGSEAVLARAADFTRSLAGGGRD